MYGKIQEVKGAEGRKPEGQRKKRGGVGLENSHRKQINIILLEYRYIKQMAPKRSPDILCIGL